MSELLTIANMPSAGLINLATSATFPSETQSIRPSTVQADEVDFTSAARLAHGDAARAARLDRIRRAIVQGEYLTPDKVDVAVDRIHAEITNG